MKGPVISVPPDAPVESKGSAPLRSPINGAVEVGKCYVYQPAGYDALPHRRPSELEAGALLRVLELNADTQCSAEAIDGTIVLVMVASLREVS